MEQRSSAAKLPRETLVGFLSDLQTVIDEQYHGSIPGRELRLFLDSHPAKLIVMRTRQWLVQMSVIKPSDENTGIKTTHWAIGPGITKFLHVVLEDQSFVVGEKKTPALNRLRALSELQKTEEQLRKEAGPEIDARLKKVRAEMKRFEGFIEAARKEILELEELKKRFRL